MAGGNHIIVREAPSGFLKRRVIRGHFSKYGSITRLTIHNNCCVLTFETPEQAERALTQGISWKDSPLKVEFTDHHDPYGAEEADINEELNWYAEDTENIEKNKKPTKTKANFKSGDAPLKKTRLDEDGEDLKTDDNKAISLFKEIPFQSRAAKTLKDKLDILEERDRYIRMKLEKTGKIDASDVVKGICPDMCPEKERLMRDVNAIVSPYESLSNGRMDHSKAVKEYTRSSADQDEPLPHELRPEPVLTMTMSYIINCIMSRMDEVNDENQANWYDFCWGRLRAIRKDIIQQQLCNVNIVTILEQCARFHIACYDRLWGTSKSHFDDKINTETLVNCLQSLIHMYEDLHREGITCPNEAEFNAYMILLKLNSGLLMSDYRRYTLSLKQSHEVKEAVKISLAYSNNMFSTYFRLIKHTTYLNACLMQRFFHHLRVQALNTIVKAYAVPNKVSNISVSFIMGMLKLDSISECASFCDSLGLTLSKDEKNFRISRNDFFIPENVYAIKAPSSLVVNKRIPVAQAVVGADKQLPIVLEHFVHNSFNEEGLLNPDAIDASDQEEKMLFDIVARNVQITRLKGALETNATEVIVLEKEKVDLSPRISVSPQQEMKFHFTETGEDNTEIDYDYADAADTSVGTDQISDTEPKVKDIDESSNESAVSFNSTSSSLSSKSSVHTNANEIKIPSPQPVDSKPMPKFNPFSAQFHTFLQGPLLNPSKAIGTAPILTVPKSPISQNQQHKFSFSKESSCNKPKVELDIKIPKVDEDATLLKLRKKLAENLKKISARKYLRLWQKKVTKIKAMKAAEALVICNVSAENHLKIWGCPVKKHFIKTSERLMERKKAALMVQLILHTDIVDKLDKNVTNIRRKLINILGETSVRHANKWGNVAQPVPIFWKLVFAVPPPIAEGSTFSMKFRIWCKEAFSNNECSNDRNVGVTVSSNGVTVFSKIIITEGIVDIEQCKNLTSLLLITANGWETSLDLKRRMQKLLDLTNHPIPVAILNIGSHLNEVESPHVNDVTFFEQLVWRNTNSLTSTLCNMARNIYLCNLKVKPYCNVMEIFVYKLFDFFRQDRYFHDELDVALLSPNNVIVFYNQLVDFIVKEIADCFKHNYYGTACEFKIHVQELRNSNFWPDGYDDPNFLNFFIQRSMKCRLKPFSLQSCLSAKDLLSFFRRYCDDLGCPEVVSTLFRLIKPPKADSEISLSDHLDTVDWLRITELLIEKVLASTLLTFKVVFREDKLNDYINSRYWLDLDVIKHCKR
ncbi:uncharacterized protein xmas [Halyomorpha halys]|uniref:uncharacterized protein xmas n=1 Tax=Halyomorpha halys TaxID=286706 RepID=UPI0006D520D5|nr:uncharacterized protein LOC106678204 [Halyomorpha halys]